jgi:hypothetical protein
MDSKIRFRALNDADSFIWEIGASKYYTKSVILNSFPENMHDKITLIAVNNHPNKNCFPADNGRDTSIHKIFTWPAESYYDVNSKIGYFPDGYRKKQSETISPRALKHIKELTALKNMYENK